ncbi:MAG: aminotransferase class I/II-fold pyridoxal phosphate-dependent enzyme, partial [Thermoproteota archaeon]|nr:aminotransferase class I/II-fold pyridoxal phosphate-dependent enzyme [Thermoproteota archaeon]
MTSERLDGLRNEMKVITEQIVSLVVKRMEIAKRIGDLKKELNISVIDDRVEQEIKNFVLTKTGNNHLNTEFAGRIVNLLINESVKIQKEENCNLANVVSNNINGKPKGTDTDLLKNSNPLNNTKIKSHMDVFNLAKKLDLQGHDIIHMEVGEPDFYPPSEVKEQLGKIYDSFKFHYTETAGIYELRKKISLNLEKNSPNIDNETKISPDNIIATVGGRFAIFSAFSTILRPGDEIIIIEPVWPAYKDCANFMGVKTRIVNTTLEDRWEPDISDIEDLININTKIICLN